MFSKADKTKTASAVARTAPSLISTDLEIAGNLQTPGEVQLDGTIEGDIVCGKLLIGEKAIVSGHIEADEVIIRGRVTGRVKGKNVHLASTARVVGDIWHDSLAIEAGAFLEGHCKRNDAPAAAATPATTAATVEATPAKMAPSQTRNADVVPARQNPVQDNAGKTVAKTAAGA